MPGCQCSRETDPYTIMFTEVGRFTRPCRVPAMLRFVDSSRQFDASTMPYQLFDDTHVGLPLFALLFCPWCVSASPVIVSYCMFCECESAVYASILFTFHFSLFLLAGFAVRIEDRTCLGR